MRGKNFSHSGVVKQPLPFLIGERINFSGSGFPKGVPQWKQVKGSFHSTLKTVFLQAKNHRGGESGGYQDYPKTIEEGQCTHQKTLLQLWMATAFCWMTAKSTLACSASAGTESTATISKTQSFPQTGSCLPRSCSLPIKSVAKSARQALFPEQTISGIVQPVPQFRSESRRQNASAENGRRILHCRSTNSLLIEVGRKGGIPVTLFEAAKPHQSKLFQSRTAVRNTIIPEHTKSWFKTVTERR